MTFKIYFTQYPDFAFLVYVAVRFQHVRNKTAKITASFAVTDIINKTRFVTLPQFQRFRYQRDKNKV